MNIKTIDMAQEKNHFHYDGHMNRPNCTNDKEIYTVLFWDDLKDTVTISEHKSCNGADRRFRNLLVNAQRKGLCVRILLVAPDNVEIQRASMDSYT